MSSTLGVVLAVCSAIAYTFNTLFLSLLGAKAGITATKYILLVALLLTLLVHVAVYRRFVPERIGAQALLVLALSGVLGYVAGYLLTFRAIAILGPQLLLLLLTVQTVMSFLLGWLFLRETVQPLSYLYVSLIIGGIVLVIMNRKVASGRTEGIWVGVVLGLALALCQTLSQLLTKKALLQGIPPMSANIVRLSVGTVVTFSYSLFAGRRIGVRAQDFDLRDWRNLSLAAAIGPVLGILLAFYALRLVSLGVAAAVLQLAPVGMLFLERACFGRRIRPVALVGTGCAVAGTVLLSL